MLHGRRNQLAVHGDAGGYCSACLFKKEVMDKSECFRQRTWIL